MISFHFDCYPLNRIFIRIQVCERSIFLGSPNLASVVAVYVYFKMTSDAFAAYFVRSRSSADHFLRLLIQYILAPFSFFLKPPKVRRLCIKALFFVRGSFYLLIGLPVVQEAVALFLFATSTEIV